MPTTIRAGAVTALVTTESAGKKTIDNRNRTPVVTAVKPVRPPTSTPEVDSTNDVTVEVPQNRAHAGTDGIGKRAFFNIFQLALFVDQTGTVSDGDQRSRRIEEVDEQEREDDDDEILMREQFAKAARKRAQRRHFKVELHEGIPRCGIFATPHRPAITPTIAVPTKPQKTAARTFFASRISVRAKPKTASRTTGSVSFPNATNVDSLATMMPAFFGPIKAMKKPMPAPIASFSAAESH